MKRKILGVLICLVLISTIIPLSTAIDIENNTNFEKEKEISKKDTYTTCYIDAYGPVDFTFQICNLPTLTENEIILYWPIIFLEPDTEVTIYSSENGDILWQDSLSSGQWELRLIGFYGLYTNPSYEEQLYVSLQGKALMVKITTE